MKIVFTKLPDKKGYIEVSLNGGSSYTQYDIDTIRENGIELDENQDYSQIQIKGTAGIIKNLDIIKNITVENALKVYETIKTPIFEDVEDGEGDTFLCYVNDADNSGEITAADDNATTYSHRVVYLRAGTTDEFYVLDENVPESNNNVLKLAETEDDLITIEEFQTKYNSNTIGNTLDENSIKVYKLQEDDTIVEWDFISNGPYNDYVNRRIRYPEGDIIGNKIFVGYNEERNLVDTISEIIDSDILEIPVFYDKGGIILPNTPVFYQAEPGKAAKRINVVFTRQEPSGGENTPVVGPTEN